MGWLGVGVWVLWEGTGGAEEGRELCMGMVGGELVVCDGRELSVALEEKGRLAGCIN